MKERFSKKDKPTRTQQQSTDEAARILKNTGGESGGVRIGRVQSTPDTKLGTPAHPHQN